jgi:hypothetical protein
MKQHDDIVSGRLGKRGKSGRSSYGSDRLGLRSGDDPEQRVEPGPEQSAAFEEAPKQAYSLPPKKPNSSSEPQLPARPKPSKPTPGLPPARPSSGWIDPLSHAHDVHDDGHSRGLLVIAAIAVACIGGVIWAFWPETPESASAGPAGVNKPLPDVVPTELWRGDDDRAGKPVDSAEDPQPHRPVRIEADETAEKDPDALQAELLAKIRERSADPPPESIAPDEPTSASAEPKYIVPPPGFFLSGIVRMGDGNLANINGKFVAEGEAVSGATVVKIRRFQVVLEMDGQRFPLAVGDGRPVPPPEPQHDDEYARDEGDGEDRDEEEPDRRRNDSRLPPRNPY